MIMKVQTQTERPFLFLSLSLALARSLCTSLSLSSCDNLNQMPWVTELRKRVMVVVVCVCVCVCVRVSMSRYVCLCMCDLKGIKSQDRRGERGGGEEGYGRAKPGVNSRGLGVEGGGPRVINLLSFVLSVCFHEAPVGPKVKAVSLKIVCLLCSMFSPQG